MIQKLGENRRDKLTMYKLPTPEIILKRSQNLSSEMPVIVTEKKCHLTEKKKAYHPKVTEVCAY